MKSQPRVYPYIFSVVLSVLSLVALSCAQPAPPTPTPTPPPAAKPAATAAPAVAPAAPTATAAPQAPKPSQATPAAAKPTEMTLVRAGHIGSAADGPTYIALEKGYFREQGINLELTVIDTAAKMMVPMAAGQLEVGRGSPNAALFNAITRQLPIKVVADITRIVNNNYIVLAGRKDLMDSGALKDYADLKGKNVVIINKATGAEIELDRALKKGNLTLGDVNIIELPFPDQAAALANKAADVAQMIEPFVTVARERGIASIWKATYDFAPDHQLAVLMYAPHFMKDKPDVARRYMVAYVKGIRDYNDAFLRNKGKSEVIPIMTKWTSIKDPAMFEKITPQGINDNGYVNAKSIMDDQDWYIAKGYIKEKFAEKDLIDNQWVDYAVLQLGRK
ncbi:MAG: ABC transporter substrate-binding protein [Chloroflexi bacterium]|nr:ABC transporter substrate-binding protein [Chloroflexota bacterium]